MITELPLQRTLTDAQAQLLTAPDVACSGGFPLWLAGGANFYSDVDLYPLSWNAYYRALHLLGEHGDFLGSSPHAVKYMYTADTWQLMHPAQIDALELMATADLSPCATALVWDDARFRIFTLYPEDIAQRVCRVLIRHDWTDYRIQTYLKKGYTVHEDPHV